jgi:hypothetical protein
MHLPTILAAFTTLAVASPTFWDAPEQLPLNKVENKVPVTLFVASQGPNSLVVENLFHQVRHKIGYKFVLKLIYTGE